MNLSHLWPLFLARLPFRKRIGTPTGGYGVLLVCRDAAPIDQLAGDTMTFTELA